MVASGHIRGLQKNRKAEEEFSTLGVQYWALRILNFLAILCLPIAEMKCDISDKQIFFTKFYDI